MRRVAVTAVIFGAGGSVRVILTDGSELVGLTSVEADIRESGLPSSFALEGLCLSAKDT